MWEQKRVYVIGAGKSGLAAAGWLQSQGAFVCLNEIKGEEDLGEGAREELRALAQRGVTLEFGAEADPMKWGAGLVLASPGVPLDLPGIRRAAEKGALVTNEVELGWQVSHAQAVGVTGSNGKTTVTSLIGRMMGDAGFQPFIGGNIGTPFIQAAPKLKETDWAVLELSSFQLAGILSFSPKVAVFLNLTPDHIDWHKSFANYAEAKWAIARFQGQEDWLVLNYDDPLLREEGERRLREGEAYIYGREPVNGPRILWFSRREKPGCGLHIDQEGWAVYSAQASRGNEGAGATEIAIMPVGEFSLPGSHNLENLLAALGAGVALGISPGLLRRSAGAFRAIEHRMEPVGEYGGVLYVNDSKATNPDSLIKALNSYSRPVLLIAGGDGKGAPFDEAAKAIAEKAKWAVLIGRDRDIIGDALLRQSFAGVLSAESLQEAVRICRERAEPGDIVLLSPACASYDMFQNYEERGRVFKEAVKSIHDERRP